MLPLAAPLRVSAIRHPGGRRIGMPRDARGAAAMSRWLVPMVREKRFVAALLLAVLAAAATLGAQGPVLAHAPPPTPSLRVDDVALSTLFDRRSGLPASAVFSLIQDARGRLLIGTEQGAFWFDGERWNREDVARHTPKTLVRAIREAPDGSTWFVQKSTILRQKAGRWDVLDAKAKAGIDRIYSLALTRALDGTLTPVIGASDGLFRLTADDRIERIASPPGFAANAAMVATEEPGSRTSALWVASLGSGVARFTNGTWRVWKGADGLDPIVDYVRATPEGDSAQAIAATASGAFLLTRDRWRRVGPAVSVSRVLRVRIGNRYETWIGSNTGELFRSTDDVTWTTIADESRLKGSRTQILEAFDQGFSAPTVFAGFRSGALVRFRIGAAGRVVPTAVLAGRPITAIAPSRDGLSLWMWALGAGPVRSPDFALPRNMPESLRKALNSPFLLLASSRDPRTELLVAGRSGLYRLRGERWSLDVAVRQPDSSVALINGVTPDGTVAPVLVTRRGGFVENADGTFGPWVGFPAGTRLLVLDTTGTASTLLRVDEDGALTRFADGRWTPVVDGTRLQDETVTSLATSTLRSGERVAWIGTSRGVQALRMSGGPPKWRLLDAQSHAALRDDIVRAVHALPTGRLAVATPGGVAVLAPGRAFDDSIGTTAQFTDADGLPHPATFGIGPDDASGRLWLMTELGAGYVGLSGLVADSAVSPTLGLSLRRVSGQPVADSASVPHEANSFIADLAFVTNHREDESRFRFELDGAALQSEGWSDQRSATLLALAPGRHELRAWAMDWRGRVAGPVRRTLIVNPPWWETPIAYFVYAVLAIGIWYTVSELRVRVVRQRSEIAVATASRLASSEEQFRALFDDGIDAQLLVHDAQVRRANLAAQALLGASNDALVQRRIDAILPDWRPRDGDPSTDAVSVHAQLEDGTRIPVEVRRRIIPIEPDAVDHLTIRDLRLQLQQAEAHRSLEHQLRESQRLESLGTLAGGMAHDFNNVLTVIQANAELALISESSLEVGTALQQLLAASARARDIVRQILTFGRRAASQRTPVSLSAILAELLPMLRATIPSTVRITLREAAADAWVLGDPTQIHQMLLNLCTNAEHAMRRRGGDLAIETAWVEPTSATPDRRVMLRVTDTGRGMDSAVLARVFDPFFTTKPVGEGTGLGLSVLHGIVGSHGGTVDVRSEVDVGTTFEVRLPSIDRPAAAVHPTTGATDALVSASAVESVEGMRSAPLVLLVDDEPAVATAVQRLLLRAGFDAEIAPDGEAAIARLRRAPPVALVISDQTMPGMTGDQLAEHVRAFLPELPFVIATGYSQLLTEERVAALRISAVLQKPFAAATLFEVARSAIASGRSVS